jgi:hypothetical protein
MDPLTEWWFIMHVTVRPMLKLQRVDLRPDKMCKNLGCENTAVN